MQKNVFSLTVFLCSACFFLTSCSSIQKMGTNAVSDMLSGYDKKGRFIEKKAGAPDPMEAVMNESDTVLIGDFLPVTLKMYEILQAVNPEHQGLSVMCGQLNVMYANAFVQSPADEIPIEYYDKQKSEYDRAKMHYLKGSRYIFSVLDKMYPGFSENVFSADENLIQKSVSQLKKSDVNALYWAIAGRLGAFSLDPLNAELVTSLQGCVAVLERAAELDREYSDGAIWTLLFTFYVSAPADFCGNMERGLECYEIAQQISGGKQAGNYVAYAENYCIAQNDEKGFVEALEKALAINPDDDEKTKLMTVIYQNRARRLLSCKSDYFLEW